MKVVGIVPAYNEEHTITRVLDHVAQFSDALIVVDDGSRDGTARQIAEWARGRANVQVETLTQNRGVSTALGCGFRIAVEWLRAGRLRPEDLVFTIDADGQHRPEYIPRIVEYMNARALDVVVTRRDFSIYPAHKKFGNAFLSWYGRHLSGFPYRDIESGFRFWRAWVVPQFLAYYTGRRYSWAQEISIITARLGLKVDNDFLAEVNYYRAGARARDGLNNVLLGLVAFLRVTFHLRSNVNAALAPFPAGSDAAYPPFE